MLPGYKGQHWLNKVHEESKVVMKRSPQECMAKFVGKEQTGTRSRVSVYVYKTCCIKHKTVQGTFKVLSFLNKNKKLAFVITKLSLSLTATLVFSEVFSLSFFLN